MTQTKTQIIELFQNCENGQEIIDTIDSLNAQRCLIISKLRGEGEEVE